MSIPRRHFLQLASGVAITPALSCIARAQAYPTRPITMIVPFAAGGLLDAIGRILAERMRNRLGQPVIIENVTGAEGSVGTGRAARARPDGYTIDLGTTGTNVVNGGFYSLSYDVLNDLVPISPVATTPVVLFARRTMPARDLTELIAWLKANPNKASAGTFDSPGRLIAAFFQKETGTQFTLVPYRGGAAVMPDLVAGQIDLFFDAPVSLPLFQAGSIKAYAVATDTRLARAPDIPTFAELGLPGFFWSRWIGLFVPTGTPTEIMGKLNAATVEALAEPALQSRLVDLGCELVPRERQTPEVLGAMQRADAGKWSPLIKEFGIKAE